MTMATTTIRIDIATLPDHLNPLTKLTGSSLGVVQPFSHKTMLCSDLGAGLQHVGLDLLA